MLKLSFKKKETKTKAQVVWQLLLASLTYKNQVQHQKKQSERIVERFASLLFFKGMGISLSLATETQI